MRTPEPISEALKVFVDLVKRMEPLVRIT